MRRRWIIVTIGVLVVVMAAMVITRAWRNPPVTADPLGPASARFMRPNLVGYQQGVRQWSLKADLIEELPQTTDTQIKLVEITEGLLYRDGEPHLRFTADGGTWRPSTEVLHLDGNVRFEQDDQQFVSDWLSADMKVEQMRFVGNVVWRSQDGSEIRADEAIYNSKEDVVEFHGTHGPVTFTFQGSDP